MNKATIGDMIESYTNPNHRGVIIDVDEGAFKAYFFVSNRTECFSTAPNQSRYIQGCIIVE